MIDERSVDDPAAFERMLLASAAADAPTELQARAAWARFVTGTGLAALAAGIDVKDGAVARAVRRAAATGFAVGALGTGVAAAAWFGSLRSEPAPASTAVELAVPAPRAARSSAAPSAAAPSLTAAAPTAAVSTAAVSTAASLSAEDAATRAGKRTRPRAPSRRSTLAGEIAALDAARGAFVGGRYAEVLVRVDAYRREFPSGQLAPDAEALSIEALAAAGNRSAAVRRAERFLDQHPNNAHTARVAAIAGR